MSDIKGFIGHVWYKHPADDGGEKVGVNWYRKGELGISFLNSDGHKVVNESEVEFKYGEMKQQEVKDDVRKESYDDLKSRLERIRKERNQYGKRRSTSKKKTQKSRRSKKSDKQKALDKLKSMDPELLKQILNKN